MKEMRNAKHGYTLVEVMIATSLFTLVMGLALSFLLNVKNTAIETESKLLISHDIRRFTNELADNVTQSSRHYIFPSYTERSARVSSGESGDMLVLIYTDGPGSSDAIRIAGYYRDGTPETEGPVKRFDIPLDPPQSVKRMNQVIDLLPPVSAKGSHREIIELSRGLSDGQLFNNFHANAIAIQGEIIHQGRVAQQTTNTYNFTVYRR